MIPLGGRVIIPQPFHRIEVAAGGGTVSPHYSETAPTGYNSPTTYYTCYACYTWTSRGGWGTYGRLIPRFQAYIQDRNHHPTR
jgi:hypothetical protein